MRIQREPQAGTIVERCGPVASFIGSCDLGQPPTSALLAGRRDHGFPVRDAPLGALGVELDLGAIGHDRHDPRDAELGRLLQDPVHFLAARDALRERDAERAFAVLGLGRFEHARGHGALGERGELGLVLIAAAVEEPQRMAAIEAQNPGEVLAGLHRKLDFAARAKRLRHVDAGDAHGRLRGGEGQPRPRARARGRLEVDSTAPRRRSVVGDRVEAARRG